MIKISDYTTKILFKKCTCTFCYWAPEQVSKIRYTIWMITSSQTFGLSMEKVHLLFSLAKSDNFEATSNLKPAIVFWTFTEKFLCLYGFFRNLQLFYYVKTFCNKQNPKKFRWYEFEMMNFWRKQFSTKSVSF